MWSFLRDLFRDIDRPRTVLVMDEEYREHPRYYHLDPRTLLLAAGGVVLGTALVLTGLIVLTPIRNLVPGNDVAQLRREARLAALRLSTLQDSLATQQNYMSDLRRIMIGQVDSASLSGDDPSPGPAFSVSGELAEVAPEPKSSDWNDHQQPALSIDRMPVEGTSSFQRIAARSFLSSLQIPALPPVNGFVTRGFDARAGHYAVDIAVETGTVVRSIGDGYVIMADWTNEGGYAIAVQHAEGYISVYKHNQRLLKQVGDRVRSRETLAISGNTGEVTTGPHLHFELWHNGLAQDPSYFLVGI